MFFQSITKEEYPEATQDKRFEFTGKMGKEIKLEGTKVISTEDDTYFTLKRKESGVIVLVRQK